MNVVVIGAGLSGLAAACHLTADGHDVTVLEREDVVGGRAGVLRLGGFRFDPGPVVMTMPDLLAAPIRAVGGDPDALVPMTQLDPAYRAVFADGSHLLVRAGLADLREEVRRVSGDADAAGFDEFVRWLGQLHGAEFDAFIDHNYRSALDLLAVPGAALRLLRLGGFRALGPKVGSFFTDERLHRIFGFQSLYAGVAPAQARALFAIITYMDTVRGVFYPDGGMHAIATGLADALAAADVPIHLGTPVGEILTRSDGAVAGVRTTEGDRLAADAVVCTVDLPVAYDQLLPQVSMPRRVARGRYSPSAVVWHLGVRGRPGPQIAHHSIHFGAQWDEAFAALIDRGELMPDPSRLVTVPSVTDPTAAPDGCTAMYVLEPVPHTGARIDWSEEAGPMRDRLLGFLTDNDYPVDIVEEQLVTPADWQELGLYRGTPFALAHTFSQSGPFRPSNIDRRVPGLVFAGSGTTPGVGIPMVLVSGRLAAERVSQYAGRAAPRPTAAPVGVA
ncbi:phytoene desaturase family protein [Branchiibius sp. NY16-3462-2]|uniref:phytoene desaturase family protein n=1 Tax=Branchiibius sp. NY16-3462-2 TaxID=1807500 RepID=UPI0007938D2E|nr:phytoene desaturase family protein [Branchiibius sp. NY16-3462-2]KYH43082.1 phytoene dehydrogenase [Branchiibius sp. NY16-3462-2]